MLAPTRELVQQIGKEVKSYASQYGMHVAITFGGGSRYEQSKTLKSGCEVVVATPGRLIDFLKDKVRALRCGTKPDVVPWRGPSSWLPRC